MDQQDTITGITPLILGQKWALTLEEGRYILELLEHKNKINQDILKKTIRHLLSRHDILRTRIVNGPDGWQQVIPSSDEPIPLTQLSLSEQPERDHITTIQETITHLLRKLDKYEGPLLHFVHFKRKDNETDLLLIIMHHLIFDYYSCRVLLSEFGKIYDSIQSGKDIQIGPKPPSFKQFAEKLTFYIQSHLAQEFEEYWSLLPWEMAKPLPADYSEKQILSTKKATDILGMSWTLEETTELMRAIRSARLPIMDVLLTALTLTVARWTNEPFVHIISMDTGRVIFSTMLNLNLGGTIGFFAANRRLFLDVRDIQSPKDALQIVRRELNHIPHKGVGLDILYRCGDEKRIKDVIYHRIWGQEAVLFNWMGEKNVPGISSWMPSGEYGNTNWPAWKSPPPPGLNSLVNDTQPRIYRAIHQPVSLDGMIINNQLWFSLKFDPDIYNQSTVEQIYQDFKKNIKEIVF